METQQNVDDISSHSSHSLDSTPQFVEIQDKSSENSNSSAQVSSGSSSSENGYNVQEEKITTNSIEDKDTYYDNEQIKKIDESDQSNEEGDYDQEHHHEEIQNEHFEEGTNEQDNYQEDQEEDLLVNEEDHNEEDHNEEDHNEEDHNEDLGVNEEEHNQDEKQDNDKENQMKTPRDDNNSKEVQVNKKIGKKNSVITKKGDITLDVENDSSSEELTKGLSLKALSSPRVSTERKKQTINIALLPSGTTDTLSPRLSPRHSPITKISPQKSPNSFVSRASMVALVKGCEEESIVDTREAILLERNDILHYKQSLRGKLSITNYKFVFVVKNALLNVSVPLTRIANFKKVNSSDKTNKRLFTLETKDNRRYVFSFGRDRATRKKFNYTLLERVYPESIETFFIFFSKTPRLSHPVYIFQSEVERILLPRSQKVSTSKTSISKSDSWRFFSNASYSRVPTYPSLILVPAKATDNMISEAMKHRSKQRFPAVTWIHPKNGAVLVRSAQPLPGFAKAITAKNTSGDVDYLREILNATDSQILRILDSRPKLNAYTNKAAGGGYEDETNYPFATVEFENIDNIHVVREAWTALCVAALNEPNEVDSVEFSKKSETKQWMKLLGMIFASVKKAAQYIRSGDNVLIHCSDGWDRTSQCCSLCELLCDEYYRTIEGFIVLIEKDWKSFGHKFKTRTGFGAVCPHGQYSPIFHQFLYCVYVLLGSFPNAFEFNQQFLLELDDAVFCSDFGTFLGDCEAERVAVDVDNRTPSFWEYVLARRCIYANPDYKAIGEIEINDDNLVMSLWVKYLTRHKQKFS
ncbi:phosphatidylinositol-3 [Entamoeba marina]